MPVLLFFLTLSLILNCFAIVVLLRSKKLSYNIRIFSINLAITDIAYAVVKFILALQTDAIVVEDVQGDCLQASFGYLTAWFYFSASFIITAMGVDRFLSIIYPYIYLRIIANKRGRITRACILLWVVSLIVTLLHDVDNNGRMFYCLIGRVEKGTVTLGFQKSKYRIVGLVNLCILVTNVSTYISILATIWKQPSPLRNRQMSSLGKIASFAVAYALLRGPFNLIAIVIGVFNMLNMGQAVPFSVIRAAAVLTNIAVLVDPAMYAWRYKNYRLQMMTLLCFWNNKRLQRLRQAESEYYSTYIINTRVPIVRETGV